MSNANIHINNSYQAMIEAYSSDPSIQKMMANQLRVYGSMDNILRASATAYSSSRSNSNSPTSSDNSPTASSNGKYMSHCYYGCQPGNKITTVIG